MSATLQADVSSIAMTSLLQRYQPVDAIQYLDLTKAEQVNYRQLLDALRRAVPFSEAFVVSTLLRGTLQVVQPQRLSDSTLRTYDRSGQEVDTLTWRAIRTGKPQVATTTDADKFASAFMDLLGFKYVAVIPLAGPILGGYPGALHVYRGAEGPAFSDSEIESLTELAARCDTVAATVRTERLPEIDPAELADDTPRFALFDNHGRQVAFAGGSRFDAVTLSRMGQMTIDRLKQDPEGQDVVGERVLIPDNDGDSLTYRAVTYHNYPALGGGKFVGFFATPRPQELAALRPTDVAADPELARLIPALKFMYNEFRKSPTLVDTAKQVHLSPFHFHRRFSELLGLTPKHFMLDCQIADAKQELVLGEKDLATIAADGGFAHQSHFTSRFKQATGLTPTRWRRMALDQRKQ
jgi:AraC-like DNA-binding protein